MPGLRWKTVLVYSVDKYPWIQVPAGEIGVVIAQVGSPLPIGAKSAVYKKEFANFSDLRNFIQLGGQKGVQRPVLPPGSLVPVHPVGFLIITRSRVYGEPISPELCAKMGRGGELMPASLASNPNSSNSSASSRSRALKTAPRSTSSASSPLTKATRFRPVTSPAGSAVLPTSRKWKRTTPTMRKLLRRCSAAKIICTNNYQDFQSFLDHGGHIGLQHDPLLYGAYALNPFLVSVEMVPMLIIKQGQVGVIKAYVGLATQTLAVRTSNTVRSFVPAIAASGKSLYAPANIRSTRVATSRKSFQPQSST